jgi:hypothetical protein
MEIKEHKVESLTWLNDADVYILITEDIYSVKGSHDDVVACLATAIVSDENFRNIVLGGVQQAINYTKNSQKNTKS